MRYRLHCLVLDLLDVGQIEELQVVQVLMVTVIVNELVAFPVCLGNYSIPQLVVPAQPLTEADDALVVNLAALPYLKADQGPSKLLGDQEKDLLINGFLHEVKV